MIKIGTKVKSIGTGRIYTVISVHKQSLLHPDLEQNPLVRFKETYGYWLLTEKFEIISPFEEIMEEFI